MIITGIDLDSEAKQSYKIFGSVPVSWRICVNWLSFRMSVFNLEKWVLGDIQDL